MIIPMRIKSFKDGCEVMLEEFLAGKKNILYRVGCDSLNIKDKTVFITTLVGIYPRSSGAFILYHKDKIAKIEDSQKRLWTEVEKAIAFATELKQKYSLNVECIDFDLNPNENYESSRLVSSALGFAESLGFKGYCKPNNIHAIHAADHIVHKSDDNFRRKGIKL